MAYPVPVASASGMQRRVRGRIAFLVSAGRRSRGCSRRPVCARAGACIPPSSLPQKAQKLQAFHFALGAC
eukprot:8735415-Pyramimonas_sp.AAC.1